MKRIAKLLVLVALGAAAQSCQDEPYNEVEQTVLEGESFATIDGHEGEEDKPGQN